MIKVDTAAIASLRDRLLETGGAPSVLMTGPEAIHRVTHPLSGDDQAIVLFEAAFEAMFIMLAADGSITDEEKDLLRGAIRELTAGAFRTAEIDKMADDAAARLQEQGAPARLKAVAEALKTERVGAEAAFVLAAAMAFADNEIAEEENETLNSFADLLDIDTDRANQLLDQLEAGA